MTWRCFTVRGIPKAQPRVKACIRGKHAGVYDPGTADGWKDSVYAQLPWDGPIDGPVQVMLVFNMPRPKRLYRRKDPVGCVPHIAKPDTENLAKSTIDAMTNAGWWRDDSQVTDLRIVKRYHPKRGHPGATIVVWW